MVTMAKKIGRPTVCPGQESVVVKFAMPVDLARIVVKEAKRRKCSQAAVVRQFLMDEIKRTQKR